MDFNNERSLLIKELQPGRRCFLAPGIKALLHDERISKGHVMIDQYNRELDEENA